MDIERLTARNKNGLAYLVKVKPNEQEVDSPYKNTLKCILDCFERLAQYEEAEIAKQSAIAKSATSEDAFPSAIMWTGKNLREVIDLTGWNESASSKWTWAEYEQVVEEKGLKIFTPSGSVMADIGDWIIYNGKDCYVTTQKNKSATSEEVAEAILLVEELAEIHVPEWRNEESSMKVGDDCSINECLMTLAITALQAYQPKEPCSECIKYQNDFNYCADCGRKLGD